MVRLRPIAVAVVLAVALGVSLEPPVSASAVPPSPSPSPNLTTTATLALRYAASAVAVDSVSHRGFVITSPSTSQVISVIDEASSSIVNTFAAPAGSGGLAVDSTRHRLYESNYHTNALYVFDDVTGTLIQSVPLGFGPGLVAVDSARDLVYVGNVQGNAVTVVDGATGSVVASIPTDPQPSDIAVNEVTGTVYVEAGQAKSASAVIDVIDESTRLVTAAIHVDWYRNIAVNSSTNMLYVPTGYDYVSVIDGSTNSVSTVRPEVAGAYANTGVDYVAVNPTTNDVAYSVSYSVENTLIANGTSSTVLETLPQGNDTMSMAIDPSNGYLFEVQITASVDWLDLYAPMAITSGAPAAALVPQKLFTTSVTTNSNMSPTYRVTAGVLPTGLQLNTTTGVISGLPTVRGAYDYTITVADLAGASASAEYTQTVGGPDYVPPVASHDFSGDGKADVLARNSAGGLYRYAGNGSGGWGAPVVTQIGSGWNGITAIIPVGDFNGDGKADVLGRDTTGALWLYPGDGRGGWKPRVKAGTGWNGLNPIVSCGDFNGDGYQDVVAVDGVGLLWLYPGNGQGGWLARQQIGSGWKSFTSIVGVSDFNGDGFPDLLARTAAGALLVYPHTPSGWKAAVQVGTGWKTLTALVSVGDFNGDGHADVIARDASGLLWLYPGNGANGFGTRVRIGSGWNGMTWIG